MNDELKIINFIQDFGCATLKQLQILFNKPHDNFKNILSKNIISTTFSVCLISLKRFTRQATLKVLI